MNRVINDLGLFNLCINLLSLIFWCLEKFPLFYLIEFQKILKQKVFWICLEYFFQCCITEIYFLYIFQLYSIITLSVTLKNLIFSVVYKFNQLMNVFYLTMILIFTFRNCIFSFFSRF